MDQYQLNKDNFSSFMDMVVQGVVRAENYNRECFSLSEVMRANDCLYVLEEIMERMFKSGYDPYMVKPVLEKHGRSYLVDQKLNLKQSLDNEFFLDLKEYAKVIDYFYAVFVPVEEGRLA